MNWKQLVSMWLGIATIVLIGLRAAVVHRFRDEAMIYVCLVGLVMGGLILTFWDRKSKIERNTARGFARITWVLSILAFAAWSFWGVVLFIYESELDAVDPGWPFAFMFAFASVAGLWLIYGIVFWIITPITRWVEKGFRNESEGTHNN